MQQASFGTLKSFTEQTFLQNINQLTAAISDPERYGPNWYKNFIASFVPTLSKDIAVSLDIKQRQTDTATEAIKARIPFLRESLKPKIDVLGKEISREGGAIRSLIDPTRPSSEKHSPVIDELTRLYDSKYLATPAAFGEEPKYDILTEKEQITLEKRAGNLFTQKVEGLIKLPAYTAATDQEKSDTIKNFATQSRLRARVEILNILMHPLTNNDDKLKELAKLKKSGFLTNQVYKEWLKLTQ